MKNTEGTKKERQLTPPGGWHEAGKGRILPLKKNELNAGQKLFLGGAQAVSKVPAWNLFQFLMRRPDIFRPWLKFAKRLLEQGTIERADTEVAILRVGWNCRCRYEWGQHVAISLREGILRESDIQHIPDGPNAPGISPRRKALLRAADEIHAVRFVSDRTWAELEKHYDKGKLLEVLMLIGHYEMLAGVLLSAGLELDEELEVDLAEADIHGH
ncbi:MAG: alkylhydroperoxidase family enzyme [Verrucomicrobiales bacterium]|jgi:alkylhydroperoxidase family enzyme